MSDTVISHEEVLHDVYAFLSHYGYKHALLALQVESGVAYNVINVNNTNTGVSKDSQTSLTSEPRQTYVENQASTSTSNAPLSESAFTRCVLNGRYDELLTVYLANTILPFEVKRNLYELIVEEMLQVHGLQPAAKALFQHAPVFAQLKVTLPARYARLEQAINLFDASAWEQSREHGTHINVNEIQSRRESVLSQLRQCIQFDSRPYQGRLEDALSLVHNKPTTLHKYIAEYSLSECVSEKDKQMHSAMTSSAIVPSTLFKRQRTEEEMETSDIVSNHVKRNSTEKAGSVIHALPYLTNAPNQIYRKLLFGADKTVSSCTWAINVDSNNSNNNNDETAPCIAENNKEYQHHSEEQKVEVPYVTAESHLSVEVSPPTPPPLQVETSPLLLTGRVNGVVDFVELESCSTVGTSVGHTSGVLCMCTDVATINNNQNHTQVNIESESKICTNTWVAVGYRDGWVKVYNTRSHRLICRLESVHSLGVTAMTFSGATFVMDMSSSSRPNVLFSGHRTFLLSASFDSSICVIDIVAGKVLYRLAEAHHGASIRSLCDLTLPLMRNTLHRSTETSRSHFYSALHSNNFATSELSGDDAHVNNTGESYVNANYMSDVVWPFVSSGDDGLLNLYEFCDKLRNKEQQYLTRLSPPITLQAIHTELQKQVPTCVQVLTQPFMSLSSLHTHTESTTVISSQQSEQQKVELIILTRSSRALIVQVEITVGDNNTITLTQEWEKCVQPLSWSVLAILNAPRPMRFATTLITHPVSMRVPMLSVFVSLNDGTICLYNVKMTWRDEHAWKSFGGSLVFHEPHDSSSVVVADHGSAIADLHLLVTSNKYKSATFISPILVAYSPSLPSVYLLHEGCNSDNKFSFP